MSGGVILFPFLLEVEADDLSESDLDSFLSLLLVLVGRPSELTFELELDDLVDDALPEKSSKSSVEVAMARDKENAAPSTESTD